MKLLYLLPLFLLAACAENEFPATELELDMTTDLRLELTCDDCNIYYYVDAETFYPGILNEFVFDTSVTNLEATYIGFIDSTESAVPWHAKVIADGIVLVDTFLIPDTFDFGLAGGVWYDF